MGLRTDAGISDAFGSSTLKAFRPVHSSKLHHLFLRLSLGQVMGFNALMLGYANADAMIEDFKKSEDAQLIGCVNFITQKPALQKAYAEKDWKKIAFFYNGKDYAINRYDEKLEKIYNKYVVKSPKISVREAQAYLTYLGFNPGEVDGVCGDLTKTAIKAFEARYKRSYQPVDFDILDCRWRGAAKHNRRSSDRCPPRGV